MALLLALMALCSGPSVCTTDVLTRDETLSQRGGWIFVMNEDTTMRINIPGPNSDKPVTFDYFD
mgnify:CR=1 FL=1